MNIDFKETSWYRVSVTPGKEEEALALCKAGKVNYPSDIVDAGLGDYNNTVSDTSEQMSVEDNGGRSTIEVIDYKEEWDNAKEIETHVKCEYCGEMTLLDDEVGFCLHCLEAF